MRFIPLHAVLLAICILGHISRPLQAEETAPAPANAHSFAPGTTVTSAPIVGSSAPEMMIESVSADGRPVLGVDFDFNKVGSVSDADSSDHSPGLLGKIFLQNRYRYFDVDNSVVGDSWQGYDMLLNLPVLTIDTPTPLDVDMFAGYVNMEIQGDRWFRPDIQTEAFNIGASIYPSHTAPLRPFLQLGARFVETDYISNDGLGLWFPNFAPTHTKFDDTQLLLNAGLEYDLFDSLAYRLTVYAETEESFSESAFMNELILWPSEHIFLRGGITADFNGEHVGYIFGGGLAF